MRHQIREVIILKGLLCPSRRSLHDHGRGKIGTRRKRARSRNFAYLTPNLIAVLIEVAEAVSSVDRNAVFRAKHDRTRDIHIITHAVPPRTM